MHWKRGKRLAERWFRLLTGGREPSAGAATLINLFIDVRVCKVLTKRSQPRPPQIPMKDESGNLYCDFCEASAQEEGNNDFYVGPKSVAICANCVDLVLEIRTEQREAKEARLANRLH